MVNVYRHVLGNKHRWQCSRCKLHGPWDENDWGVHTGAEFHREICGGQPAMPARLTGWKRWNTVDMTWLLLRGSHVKERSIYALPTRYGFWRRGWMNIKKLWPLGQRSRQTRR